MSNISKGYKQTEVGLIPEDWEVRKFPDVCWFQEGPGLRNWQFTKTGIKVINVTNLENGYLNLERTDRHISMDEFNKMYQHFEIDDKDIVVASSGNSYAKVAVARKQDLPLVMNTSVIRFKPSKGLEYDFLLAFLKSNDFKDQIDLLITGGAQPNFGPAHLKKVVVPLPPTKAEQTAIAAALSDADALINSLEALIAKKRNIKQGAMQALLTGKKRLPGFSGEWEVKKLGEIGIFTKGQGVRKNEAQSGTIPCVRYGELYTHHNDYIKKFYSFISMDIASTAQKLKMGDILFAGSGETKEEIGKCVAFVDSIEAYAGGDVVILSPIGVDSLFLGYYLNSPQIIRQKANRGQGDAIVHISANSLRNILISLPATNIEQTAIATIIFDMDAEIEQLEQKLDKYKMIKQGMMQELLTGKTRLV